MNTSKEIRTAHPAAAGGAADQRRSPPSTPQHTELLELLRFALEAGVTPGELRSLMSSGIQPGGTCVECLGDMEPSTHGLKCVRCGASRTPSVPRRGRA